MAFKSAPPRPTGRKRDIPMEDLRSFVNDFPALLWRIEIPKSRIEFLNSHVIAPLGDGTRLLLQNAEYARSILVPEDAHLMEAFLDAVKEGRTMATVFRARSLNGDTVWLKLTGAVNSRNPRFYYGYLLDIRDTVMIINSIQNGDARSRLRIENSPTPVILLHHSTRRVRSANAAARELFGLPQALGRARVPLGDLHPGASARLLERILDELPVTRTWEGVLEFTDAAGQVFSSETTLRYLGLKNRGLVHLSLSGRSDGFRDRAEAAPDPLPEPPTLRADLTRRLRGADDIVDLLRLAQDSPAVAGASEAIMLSDIHATQNRVLVYGAGDPLEGMPPGEEFSYRGTIAEDIVRFGLDFVEVEDTVDSIKPIDWALFIPRGIRSYFAKPFFERGVLRTVLILCSTTPGRFSGKGPDDFDAVLQPLAQAARRLRRGRRAG